MSAEGTIERDLDVAIAAGGFLALTGRRFASCGDELDAAEVRAARPEIRRLYQSALDSLHHPIMLVGYLEGFAARTALRVRLLASAPVVDDRADAPFFIDAIGLTGGRVAEELGSIRARMDQAAAVGRPSEPGPARTCRVAAEHMAELAIALPALVARLSATAGLQAEARHERDQVEAELHALGLEVAG